MRVLDGLYVQHSHLTTKPFRASESVECLWCVAVHLTVALLPECHISPLRLTSLRHGPLRSGVDGRTHPRPLHGTRSMGLCIS